MANVAPRVTNPSRLSAKEMMAAMEARYFEVAKNPYETLGFSFLYNETLPEKPVVKRLGCYVDRPQRMEGFIEKGFHFAMGEHSDPICEDLLEFFTIDGRKPHQIQIDVTKNSVCEQVVYELPVGMPVTDVCATPDMESDEWFLYHADKAPVKIDFSALEDEMLIFRRADGSKSTTALSSEQAESVLTILNFWLKVKVHFIKNQMKEWIPTTVTTSEGKHYIAILNNNRTPIPFIDAAEKLDNKLGADMIFLKSNIMSLTGCLIREYIEYERETGRRR